MNEWMNRSMEEVSKYMNEQKDILCMFFQPVHQSNPKRHHTHYPMFHCKESQLYLHTAILNC